MNKKIVKLLMEWVILVAQIMLYQSNIFPHEDLRDLANATEKLVKALEEEK